ncbi:MAG: hypothetical protein ACYTGG_06535 [Planctomycetota bacterium]|jgi:hypothetical protein
MRHRNFLFAFMVLLGATETAPAGNTFVEGFEDGTNEAGWTWGTGNELIVPDFGNPGAYLTDTTLITFTPIASTGLGFSSEFTGNYRQRGVISVGIDLIIFDANLDYGNRPLTLILYNYNGTPFNFDDDFGAFFVGDKDVPDPGGAPGVTPAGWTDFDFAVQSQATTTPPGWTTFRFDGGPAGDPTWNELMLDVDEVDFQYGIPGQIYVINSWELGMDNPRITEGANAVGACCFATGDCLQLDEADCVSAGGVYQGANVSCGEDTCTPTGPVGACCAPDTGECLVTSQELCVAFGGEYQGDDTICEPETCEPPVDPCGQPDAGDCCWFSNTPGCSDAECCELVCTFDPFCCDFSWDGICVDRANEFCELCGARDERTLTFKQGACPSPVNLSSFGFVIAVLAGDTDFDVANVDLASLELRRCNALGNDTVAPASFFTRIEDLNHPIEDVIFCNSCACDENQSSDGIPDLRLMFATGGLNLLLSPDDVQVTLELRGQMIDGTEFRGRDCVRIVPPRNIVPGNVTVESNLADALIEAAPPDRNFDQGGFANFALAYLPGTNVTFTAPASQGDRPFRQWVVDGIPQPVGQLAVTVSVTNQTVVRAVYWGRRDLLNPAQPIRSTVPG